MGYAARRRWRRARQHALSKRPTSSHALWCAAMRAPLSHNGALRACRATQRYAASKAKFTEENPGLSKIELRKVMQEAWPKVTAEEKAPYEAEVRGCAALGFSRVSGRA